MNSKRKSLKRSAKKTIRHSNIKGLSKYNETDKIDWVGYHRYYGYFFIDYLNQKYDNVCAKRGLGLHYSQVLEINQSGKNFSPFKPSKDLDEVYSVFTNCKKRFIVIPVGFLQHQNILIYDTQLNEFELFDSYGSTVDKVFIDAYSTGFNITRKKAEKLFIDYYSGYINNLKLFCEKVQKGSKFFTPVSFFPEGKDFQELEIKSCPSENFKINSWGFCVVWSFWYAENRLKYPNKTREKIISEIMDLFESGKADNVICRTIRGYTVFLTKLDKDKKFYERYGLHYYLYRDIYGRLAAALTATIASYAFLFYSAYKGWI